MNRTQIFSPYSHTLSPPHLITFHKGHFRTQMSTPLPHIAPPLPTIHLQCPILLATQLLQPKICGF